jgi:hypothetical protein
MAADVKPVTYFGAGYAADGTNHLVKLNNHDAGSNKLLKHLTDAQSDPTTGDSRQILLALFEMAYEAYIAQVNANNRPKQMSLQRNVSTDASGNFTIQISGTFTFVEDGTWTMTAEI